jgi:hypothetical protein
MVPWASSWLGPVVGMGRDRCISINKAVDKLRPVLLVEGFSDPVLKGAKIIDRDFRYVDKEEA